MSYQQPHQLQENQTPLHSAARTGSIEAVGLLVGRGAVVDAVTNDNYTPLHAAAKEGHCDVIQLLLDQGADQSIKTLVGGECGGWCGCGVWLGCGGC